MCHESFDFVFTTITAAPAPEQKQLWCTGTGVFTIGLTNIHNVTRSCLLPGVETDNIVIDTTTGLFTSVDTFYDENGFIDKYTQCAQTNCV